MISIECNKCGLRELNCIEPTKELNIPDSILNSLRKLLILYLQKSNKLIFPPKLTMVKVMVALAVIPIALDAMVASALAAETDVLTADPSRTTSLENGASLQRKPMISSSSLVSMVTAHPFLQDGSNPR